MTKTAISQFFYDMTYLPTMRLSSLSVWRRNFLYFRYTFLTSLTWIFIEPLLYLMALGYGLGQFVPAINGQTYAEFIAPAMMTTSGMFVAFFEGTYSTYTKMSRQYTYHTILLSPLSADEILIGELLWVTSKAFLSVVSVGVVLIAMGLIPILNLLPSLVVLFLMCWVFAAMGIWLSTIAKSYEWFSYSQSGFIMPMSLFCGTYFPIENLPDAFEKIAYALPLTHGLMSVRMFLSGNFNSSFFINVTYLFLVAIILTNIAASRFKRRLIL